MPARLAQQPVHVSVPTSNSFDALAEDRDTAPHDDLDERVALALRLIDALLDEEDTLVKMLVLEEKVDAWVQDQQGWTALHAAAYTGNVEHVKLLLRKSNAVWAMPDNLGCTAGDIAFSMNHDRVYEELLAEGIRAEMLRSVLESASRDGDDDDSAMAVDPSTDVDAPRLSTTSSNTAFLSSRLTFTTDSRGQHVALDAEGNGVMMNWEEGIMRRTVEAFAREGEWESRKGRRREELVREEEAGEREEVKVLNVGFGLGIIDSHLQRYSPTSHLIIEPHPDVLSFARQNGWFDKPGVRFYKGTWKDWMRDLEQGGEEYEGWDAVYFDTYSENYADLHRFFELLPDILFPSPLARFSFFHGLGATSRLLYDIYTSVSEMHLREIGLKTEWEEVDVAQGAVGRWESTGESAAQGEERTQGEGEKKYWREEMVGRYRLPVCRLEM
ncbi:Arginine N-methyltransferase 2 [Rhodotorula toruloides]